MIGKPAQYVGRIERGIQIISGDVVKSISDATGVSADYIIHGTVDPLATVVSLYGMSNGQIQGVLKIVGEVANLITNEDGNNMLLKDALRRSKHRKALA
jgi:transcriptional regulator with XRE-family HTH domain